MRGLCNLTRAGALAIAPAICQASHPQEAASFPHLTGGGEGLCIEYGPGHRGNIVGDGAVSVRGHDSEKLERMHLDMQYARHRMDGRVPLAVGTGEHSSAAYVTPAPSSDVPLIMPLRRLSG